MLEIGVQSLEAWRNTGAKSMDHPRSAEAAHRGLKLPRSGDPPLRIMQQIKDEMDIEHVSFLGLFKERLSAALQECCPLRRHSNQCPT